MTLERGELHALLGPSGCGKTTCLRMVAGFETPDSGEILLNGVDIAPLKPYQRNVSTVFQSYALFPHLTVFDNVAFGLRQRGEKAVRDKVMASLEMVQLAAKADRRPAQMSGGEKQRAALARSLVLAPDLLLLDEPLSALDPNLRQQVRHELKALQRRVGITFLMVTHDQEEALSLADRITLLNQGRVEQVGTPQEIYLAPANRFTANFLGEMNWLDDVGVRPESTRLSHQAPEPGVRVHPGQVTQSTFLGDCYHIQAEIGGGRQLMARVPRSQNGYHPGDRVHVWWQAADELHLPQ
ncbi:MAG: ABC transporter ATP-binding protein [Bryobacteraceae bacterium]|nr:ABC transporter ATP-binding protein [Bryobacteraceae bacterium]